MADNTTLSTNVGSGDVIRTDDNGGVKTPVSKIELGVDGSFDGFVAATNPMPVKGTGTAGTANAGVLTVQGIASMTPVQIADNSGSLTVDNAGTFAVQVDGAALTALQLIDNIVFAEDAAHVSGDSGVMALAVRTDTLAALAGTTGDYAPLEVDSIGRLYVNTEIETCSMRCNGVAATPKFAIIDAATSGDNTLVAAVGGKKIRVLSLVLVAAGTVNVRFESGASGTALTGQLNLTANSGFSSGFCPVGHFETAAATLLNLELSAAISVDGWLVYVEV